MVNYRGKVLQLVADGLVSSELMLQSLTLWLTSDECKAMLIANDLISAQECDNNEIQGLPDDDEEPANGMV